MATKTKAAPKPDPSTIASSPGEVAKKQQELANRRKGGFYSQFRNISPTSTTPMGGDNQTLG